MLYRGQAPLLVFLAPGFFCDDGHAVLSLLCNIYNALFEIKGMIANGRSSWLFQLASSLRRRHRVYRAQKHADHHGPCGNLSVVWRCWHCWWTDQKGQQFFRVVYFFPIIISATAIGFMLTYSILMMAAAQQVRRPLV